MNNDVKIKEATTIVDLLCESGIAISKSDARRLVISKGVKVGGEVVDSLDTTIEKDSTITVGKHKTFIVTKEKDT